MEKLYTKKDKALFKKSNRKARLKKNKKRKTVSNKKKLTLSTGNLSKERRKLTESHTEFKSMNLG